MKAALFREVFLRQTEPYAQETHVMRNYAIRVSIWHAGSLTE